MKRLPIVEILIISTMPLSAHGQQPDLAKLRAGARKVVSIIKSDKARTQAYCQIADLDEQMDQTVKERDKNEELAQRIKEGDKQLVPNTSR